jgi:hypothetical protein
MKTVGWAIAVGLFLTLASLPAVAGLGEDGASIADDKLAMQADVVVTVGEIYTVHEMRLQSGTVVRQFISPLGRVFGVAWAGPFMPDLRRILGPHFDRYVELRSAPVVRRGHFLVEAPELVVETGGHMRAWLGRAYLPSLLPAGVSAQVIR